MANSISTSERCDEQRAEAAHRSPLDIRTLCRSATTRPSRACLVAAVERYAAQTAKAHFVTYRNNLNKLLATLHCPNDDWCIGVKRLAGDQR